MVLEKVNRFLGSSIDMKCVIGQMSLDDSNELLQSTLFSKEEGMEDAFAKEITRYYNSELHNIASIVGGVKLITNGRET